MSSLLFLTDDLHYSIRGNIAPKAGNDTRFIAGFASHFDNIILCVPIQDTPVYSGKTPDWPSNVEFAPLAPYTSVLGYAKRLPLMLWRNLPVLWKAIKCSDMVWIRLPAANGIWAFLFAKLTNKMTVIFVVGDSDKVSRANPRYHGWKKYIRNIGVWLDWKATLFMARNSLALAYGDELARQLRQGGCQHVEVTFTSLLKADDFVSPEHVENTKSRFHFVYVGRLSHEKRIDVLLKAAARIATETPITLHIVGGGPIEDVLKRQASVLKSNQLEIKFWGYLPHGREMDQLLSQADCFVLPSISEGVPKVILEVMARGIPVIASKVGGIPSLIKHNENGLLVEPDNVQALADAMRIMIVDDEKRIHLAWGGFRYAQEHTQAKQVERIWNLVQRYIVVRKTNGLK